uniref:Uncharacterized protein n=1 Tax=Arundo donax TaxID=35708 RepID=A0A0A9G3I8_ARUDO
MLPTDRGKQAENSIPSKLEQCCNLQASFSAALALVQPPSLVLM